MSLHMTPEEHEADPPSAWIVEGSGRKWELKSSHGCTLDTFTTQRAALDAKEGGFMFSLYEREGRWFAGELVSGWKPWAEVAPGRYAAGAWTGPLVAH